MKTCGLPGIIGIVLVELFWFYGHFSKQCHFQFYLRSRDISVRDCGFCDFHTLFPRSPLIRANKTENLWTAITAVSIYVQKSGLADFQYLASKKYHYIKHLPQKRMIPRSLTLVNNLESMPTSWNTVIFKFRLIFATDERSFVSGKDFYKVFWGTPIDPWQQKKHGSMGFHKTPYGRLFPTILHSSVAKIKRNLKMTVF